MIGTAIRKYAEAHGMTCDGGYAYGWVNGRYIAMLDGYGVKMLQIYLYPPDHTADGELLSKILHALQDCDREYRLPRQNAVNVGNGRAVIVFQDGPGAIKRVERYIDEVVPRLDELDLPGSVCAHCGQPLDGDINHVLLDDYVLPVHAGCVTGMAGRLDAIESRSKEGSLARGALGAVLGAVLGAIPWAIVYVMGYVAGIVGLLVGYLSNALYGKFGGKNSRARVAVVVAALILGVTLGQTAGVSAVFAQAYGEEGGMDAFGMTRAQYVLCCWDRYLVADQSKMLGNMYDRMISNLPDDGMNQYITRSEFIELEWNDGYPAYHAEAVRELAIDMGVGLLFGAIGCIGLFSQINRQTKKKTVRKLK